MNIRGRQFYSREEYLLRAGWAAFRPAFRWSPRLLHGFRRGLLRLFGADVGAGVEIYPSARIACPWNLAIGARSAVAWDAIVYSLGRVEIGERVVISQGAHLCAGTHDYEKAGFPVVRKEIRIEDDVWIAAEAFIGPGVCVGRGAVIGARAVVMSDVAPGVVVAGNPARVVKTRNYEGPNF